MNVCSDKNSIGMKMIARSVFSCLFIYGITASMTDLFLDPPSITPDESYVMLAVGTDFNLTCASEYPITWKPFEHFTGRYEVYHIEQRGQELRYQSTIQLFQITFHSVGYFFCVRNETQHVYDYSDSFLLEHRFEPEISGLKEIYVYVNDVDNVLVYSNMTAVYENEYLIVPCKPSILSVHAKLYEDGYEVDYVLYDKTIGFVIKFTDVADIYGKTFDCSHSPPIVTHTKNMTFKVTYRTPKIESTTGWYGIQGEQLALICTIVTLKNEKVIINWKLPNPKRKPSIDFRVMNHSRSHLQYAVSSLTIKDVDIVYDQGYYECGVTDKLGRISDKVFIETFDKSDKSIDIKTLSGEYKMEISSTKQTAIWQVKYRGSRNIKLVWYDNLNKIIEESDKYEVKTTRDYTILKINYLGLTDSGNFTLKALDSGDSTEKHFELTVLEAPRVSVRGPQFVHEGDQAEFVCDCAGYPLSIIKWTFDACSLKPTWPNCDAEQRTIEAEFSNTTSQTASRQRSVLKLNALESGKVECVAVNTQGKTKSEAFLMISDEQKPFSIEMVINFNTGIFVGDNVTATCKASAYYYSNTHWYLNGGLLKSNKDRQVERCDEEYSYCELITWNHIKKDTTGRYECRATISNDESYPKIDYLNITVYEPKAPEISSSSVEYTELRLGNHHQLFCNLKGLPVPKVEWYLNKKLIENDNRIRISDNMQSLDIEKTEAQDYGDYECIGKNRFGSVKKSFHLKIIDSLSIYWIIGAVVLTLVFISSIVYLFVRFRRLRLEMNAAGLANFEEGDVDGINPELALHEQADRLPYNRKFEFPKEKLKLGKQLGAGAFGIVTKGWATGMFPHQEETTVAVKMLKKTAENEEIRALVMELKIMVHLGQHLNVVNLLGAVTKNITKRELMVIVEFCRYGNVQNFLIKHRKYFVNQIIDGSIDTEILSKELRFSNDSESGSYSGNAGPVYANVSNPMDRVFVSNSASSSTGSHVLISNNSTQSAGYVGPMRFITTTDLVCWAFQVARGMHYLSSRNVLHGDLAARNILLADGNVVKICDFGLARSLYKCSNYKKEGEAPLPFKWLAIESIRDQVFSTCSDVWSFGVVLWELFSLGSTPYPGMEADQNLFIKLQDGYRMDKPEYATQEIYDIMLHCWNFNPESRPLFNALEVTLRKLLDVGTAQHYIDLNEQYVQMNDDNFKQSHTDYLAYLAPPEEVAPSLRYLPMKPILDSSVCNTGHVPGIVNNPGYVARGELNILKPILVDVNV